MKGKSLAVAVLALFFGTATPLVGNEERFALRAPQVFTGEGPVLEDGAVVIQGGKILSVMPGVDLPKDIRTVVFEKGMICPGLIDPFTALGAEGQNRETASALEPDAWAGDLFDPGHRDFCDALGCGIIAVCIAPSAQNVVGGRAQAVRTGGGAREERLFPGQGPLVMTLSSQSLNTRRTPTSRTGAVDLLRRALSLREPVDSPDHCFFIADASYDIVTGLQLSQAFDLSVVFVGAAEADDALERLKGLEIPLVFGPFDTATEERLLRLPAAAAGLKIPVVFTARPPERSPSFLRITAALAVRAGLDRDLALAAVTARAAAVCGINDRVGTLKPGMDADMAVFSDHPMNLTARLIKVYIMGREQRVEPSGREM